MDAVHKRSEEREGDGGGGEGGGGSSSSTPRIEEITDTMIFSPTDLVTMTCRDVDLNFAIRGLCECSHGQRSTRHACVDRKSVV